MKDRLDTTLAMHSGSKPLAYTLRVSCAYATRVDILNPLNPMNPAPSYITLTHYTQGYVEGENWVYRALIGTVC